MYKVYSALEEAIKLKKERLEKEEKEKLERDKRLQVNTDLRQVYQNLMLKVLSEFEDVNGIKLTTYKNKDCVTLNKSIEILRCELIWHTYKFRPADDCPEETCSEWSFNVQSNNKGCIVDASESSLSTHVASIMEHFV